MSFNLLDSVRALFNNEVVSKTASSLGESESGIQKALSGIIPLIFGGILSKSNSGDTGSVLDMARNAAGGGGLMNTLKGLAVGDSGSIISRGMDMVRGLFGGHAATVNRTVADYSGIKESSANSLLALAAPVALGRLGEHAAENNMSASGLSSFLESQKAHIMNAMPSGLNLASIPGLSELGSLAGNANATTTDIRNRTAGEINRTIPDSRPGGAKWVLPLILVVLAALALWYFLGKGCNQQKSTTGMQDTTSTMTTAPVHTDTATGNMGRTSTKVRLVNGTELNAYAGGVEEQLVNCLNDASCMAGKDKWFDFDNINFEVGSATMTPESGDQIKNIVAILNAYPAARIKVGGYTDKTGNEASNKKLSQQRADAVASAIKTAGGKPGQITGAEGYGSAFAKVPATATDEERKKDRRIALQLNGK
ncbi:MAG TPA: OmpA family protein [Flavisolibacter sp.]|nr:OmpA family protein [Flavisolibacter sp.]